MFLARAVSFTPPTHLHLHPHAHTHKQWLTAGHRGGGEASGSVLMCLEVFKCLLSAAGLLWASVQRPSKHHFLLASREVLSMSCLPDVLLLKAVINSLSFSLRDSFTVSWAWKKTMCLFSLTACYERNAEICNNSLNVIHKSCLYLRSIPWNNNWTVQSRLRK